MLREPPAVNLFCKRGVEFSLGTTRYDDQAETQPTDLTGYTAQMQVREEDGDLVVELTDANSRILLGGTLGTVDLVLTAAETLALTAGDYDYDCVLIDVGGVKTLFLTGKFHVIDTVIS